MEAHVVDGDLLAALHEAQVTEDGVELAHNGANAALRNIEGGVRKNNLTADLIAKRFDDVPGANEIVVGGLGSRIVSTIGVTEVIEGGEGGESGVGGHCFILVGC